MFDRVLNGPALVFQWALICLLFVGCNLNPQPSLFLSPENETLEVGYSMSFSATPGVIWFSSDPKIASVDKTGQVTAHQSGTINLTVSLAGHASKTTSLTVVKSPVRSQISASMYQVCQITNGTQCWGSFRQAYENNSTSTALDAEVPTPIQGLPQLISISSGDGFTCGISIHHRAYCWGNNSAGQIGGAQAFYTTPVSVLPDQKIISISAGGKHTCAVNMQQKIYCWGSNDKGQLGSPVSNQSKAPTPILSAVKFSSVSAGYNHTCAIDVDKVLYCWGDNSSGELGIGTTEGFRDTPQKLPSLYLMVSTGAYNTCGIDLNQKALCWGKNTEGQLGLANTSNLHPYPAALPTTLNFERIVLSRYNHTCAVTTDHQAYCWGRNEQGQLGNGTQTDIEVQTTPQKVALQNPVREIAVGLKFSCSLGDETACWGSGLFGTLGDGSYLSRTPQAVQGNLQFSSISTGAITCGTTLQHKAYCWGNNHFYQLGTGDRITTSVPVAVKTDQLFKQIRVPKKMFWNITHGVTNQDKIYQWGQFDTTPVSAFQTAFINIAQGVEHACGLTSAGKAYCWGKNTFGQLGDNTFNSNYTPVAVQTALTFIQIEVGEDHSCGLTTDHLMYCWGSNNQGQFGAPTAGLPLGITDKTPVLKFESIASSGEDHMCGITLDKKTYCWGGYVDPKNPLPDQTIPPTQVHPQLQFTQVAVSGRHACGITSEQELYCWGNNDQGQLGNGTLQSSSTAVKVAGNLKFEAVQVDSSYSCALSTNHQAYCWGFNESGRLGNGKIAFSWVPRTILMP